MYANTEGRKQEMQDVIFRHAVPEDLEEITEIEAICFPPNEACDKENFRKRLAVAADHFLLMVDTKANDGKGRIMGFVNDIASHKDLLEDDMFTDAVQHEPDGAYLIVLGLDMRPEYRHGGNATRLMNKLIQTARETGRKGLVLTCHDYLVPYYQKFGYQDLGISASSWGGETWNDMRLVFDTAKNRDKMQG